MPISLIAFFCFSLKSSNVSLIHSHALGRQTRECHQIGSVCRIIYAMFQHFDEDWKGLTNSAIFFAQPVCRRSIYKSALEKWRAEEECSVHPRKSPRFAWPYFKEKSLARNVSTGYISAGRAQGGNHEHPTKDCNSLNCVSYRSCARWW